MDYSELNRALDELYLSRDGDYISSGHCLDGEGMGFHLRLEDGKYTRLYTNENFAAYFEDASIIEREKYMPYVERICRRYGVEWDDGEQRLYIRFRRNALTLAEAVARLHGAALLCASLGHTLFA